MQQLPTILLIEDDDGHAVLLQSSLRRTGFQNQVIRCHDGQEALEFLFGKDGGAAKTGSLLTVVTDIRMPKVDGLEVLRRIRESPVYCSVPVIMVTTTDDPREVERCQSLGASAHLLKSMDRHQFNAGLQALAAYFAPAEIPAPSPPHDKP